MEGPPTPTGALLFTVNRLEYLFSRMVERTLREVGVNLTPEEAQVLLFSRIMAGSSVTELSRFLIRDRTTVTRLLASLEQKGYVLRVQDERDRRVQRVQVTVEGEAALALYAPAVKGRINAMTEKFDPEQIEVAMFVLRTFQVAIAEELVAMGDDPPLDPSGFGPPR